jgi:UDP-3-O-[3-hydroxymyristoyl] glucosamine N-acyltransferase
VKVATFIHPTATVEDPDSIGENCRVGEYSVIRRNVKILDGTSVEAFCLLGSGGEDQTVIGENSVIRSHTVIYAGVNIGSGFASGHHVTIRSGAMIGEQVSIGTLSDIQGDCAIGDFSRLHSNVHVCQGAKIGRFCWIYPGVIMTNDARPPSNDLSGPTIEDEVVLTVNVTLLPGVLVRRGTVALPGATIAKDTEADSLHFGPRGTSLERSDVIKMPGNNEAAYPWINRFGEDRYPTEAYEVQIKSR